MATWIIVNKMFIGNLAVVIVLLQFLLNSTAHLLVGDVDKCESTCASTYSSKEMPSQMICQQGCRLMSISDFMASGTGNMNEAQALCLQSCKEAYTGNDMQSACAFGCQAQIPNIEGHHKHLEAYYQHQMKVASAMSGVHSYYSRMMDCLVDHISYQVGFGWNVRSSGEFGQMTVIVSGDGNVEPIFDTIVIGGVDQKTSSSLETSLVSLDRGATPNLKGIQLAESAVLVDRPDGDGQHVISDTQVDWMFCIERTGTSKKLVLLIIVVMLTSIVLCICTGTSAPGQPYWHATEKFSINGDLDYLKSINKDDLLISTKPQEPVWSAPPLPTKIPIHAL